LFLVGVLELASTYYSGEGDQTPVGLRILADVLLTVFALEVALKIIAEGGQPWRYWTGYKNYPDGAIGQQRGEHRWNWFDSAVTAVSIVQRTVELGNGALNFTYVRVIRMFRLLRVLKMVRYMRK
jgi:hypothetical protein